MACIELSQASPDPAQLVSCFPQTYAGVGQTLEIVFAHRLHLGGCGPDAAQLRPDAEAGGSLAKK